MILVNILGIVTVSTITFTIAMITRNSILTIISTIILMFIYMLISTSTNIVVVNLLPFNLVINALNNHVQFNDIVYLLISLVLTMSTTFYICNKFLNKKEFK